MAPLPHEGLAKALCSYLGSPESQIDMNAVCSDIIVLMWKYGAGHLRAQLPLLWFLFLSTSRAWIFVAPSPPYYQSFSVIYLQLLPQEATFIRHSMVIAILKHSFPTFKHHSFLGFLLSIFFCYLNIPFLFNPRSHSRCPSEVNLDQFFSQYPPHFHST